jgi:molybdopterin converting factor small subunit
MKVIVKLSEPIWRVVGVRRLILELEGSEQTVADVLDELMRLYPGFEEELHGEADVPYSLFLRDALVRLADVGKTKVKDGDTLSILLPIGGGGVPRSAFGPNGGPGSGANGG